MNIGHNSSDVKITVEVRLFNSITKFANGNGTRFELQLDPGATVGQLMQRLGIPSRDVFLTLVNGRDITPGCVGDPVRGGRELDDGDVVAFSGAVPYSFGYGAPVV